MALKIRINRKSVDSMTRQLTNQLGDLISTGALAIGSLLPSERTLANSLGVARNVVRGSYEYLEKAGRLGRRRQMALRRRGGAGDLAGDRPVPRVQRPSGLFPRLSERLRQIWRQFVRTRRLRPVDALHPL